MERPAAAHAAGLFVSGGVAGGIGSTTALLRASGPIPRCGVFLTFQLAAAIIETSISIVFGMHHVRLMLHLRWQRDEMRKAGLIHAQSGFPISLTLIVAVVLFVIGLLAVVGMVFDVGPLEVTRAMACDGTETSTRGLRAPRPTSRRLRKTWPGFRAARS